MTKGKRTKGESTICKTLRRKLKIVQHELHLKPGVNSGTPQEYSVPAPHVVHITYDSVY